MWPLHWTQALVALTCDNLKNTVTLVLSESVVLMYKPADFGFLFCFLVQKTYLRAIQGTSLSVSTHLCMSDRWQRGKPLQQLQRLPGRTESGTPAWSVYPSGTAGRHRPGAARTHLQRCSTDINSNILYLYSRHLFTNSWTMFKTILACFFIQTSWSQYYLTGINSSQTVTF